MNKLNDTGGERAGDSLERVVRHWVPAPVPLAPVTYERRWPCAYCNGVRVTLETDGAVFRVACECGAAGRPASNPVLAITWWNNVARTCHDA